MSARECCPRCASNRITTSCALGACKQTCDRCGEEWGDAVAYLDALSRVGAEERAKPPAFPGDDTPIVLLGVNPWWHR